MQDGARGMREVTVYINSIRQNATKSAVINFFVFSFCSLFILQGFGVAFFCFYFRYSANLWDNNSFCKPLG